MALTAVRAWLLHQVEHMTVADDPCKRSDEILFGEVCFVKLRLHDVGSRPPSPQYHRRPNHNHECVKNFGNARSHQFKSYGNQSSSSLMGTSPSLMNRRGSVHRLSSSTVSSSLHRKHGSRQLWAERPAKSHATSDHDS